MTQEVQTHKNCEFSEEFQRGLYGVLHTGSTSCALQDTCMTCVAYTDWAWTDGALLPSFLTCASLLAE